MNVVTPEPLVNNAWRNLLIQDFSIINGDRMNYSAGNQYEKMYAAESSDAALPIMWWGHERDLPRLLLVILDINDKRLHTTSPAIRSTTSAAITGKAVIWISSKQLVHVGKPTWI